MSVTYQFRVVSTALTEGYEFLLALRAKASIDEWPEIHTAEGGHKFAMTEVRHRIFSRAYAARVVLEDEVIRSDGTRMFDKQGKPFVQYDLPAASFDDFTGLGDFLTLKFLTARGAVLFAYAMQDLLTDARRVDAEGGHH